ncbi:MAG: MFS transporter [Chloroflexota bacterium]|nr:MFS transporter [Chloroflexota bacterium]MDE2958522.1 MFS transporter [Chloroflexota bacterium]
MAANNPARPGLFYGWFVVATCMFIAFLTMGTRNAFGAFVVPMEAEFEWNRTVVSWAAALGALLNGVSQPFMGYLFDRFGVRIVVVSGILIVGVSTLLMAATSSMWYLIGIFGVVAAIGQSGTSLTNTGAMLSKWFRRRRGLVIGLNASGMSLGGLIIVPFAAYMISLIDWRLSWVVMGVMILALGIPMALVFLHDDPAKKGLTPDGDPLPEAGPDGSPGAAAPPPQPLFAENWRQAFRSFPIWQMSFSYFICGSTTFMLSVHFVPMAVEEGISPQTAALIFGLMSGLNALGATGAGWISDRIGRRKNWLAAVYFCRGTGYVILVASLVVPGIPVMAGLLIFSFVAGLSWIATAPLTTSLTAEVYGLKSLATISGVAFLFHQLGGFTSVLMAGYLREITGDYVIAFSIAAVMLYPAAISAFTIRERKYSVRYLTAPAPAGAAAD